MAIASAIIGGALAAGGSILASKSANKAASKAAGVAQDTAAQNNALAANIYGQNKDILSPYVQRGNVAGNALNDFYGLSQSAAQQPQVQPNAMTQFAPQGMIYEGMDGPYGGRNGVFEPGSYGMGSEVVMPGAVTGFGGGTFDMQGNPVTVGTQGQAAPSSADAFKRYIANSDYAFQFGEGANKVNSGYAGAGTIQSGAAMKAMEDYRQNLQSGYRNEWASGVANQQGVGLGAGSALAGVGQNYVNTISNNNNNAGTAAANAALSKQNGLANALGMFGGSILSGGIKF